MFRTALSVVLGEFGSWVSKFANHFPRLEIEHRRSHVIDDATERAQHEYKEKRIRSKAGAAMGEDEAKKTAMMVRNTEMRLDRSVKKLNELAADNVYV